MVSRKLTGFLVIGSLLVSAAAFAGIPHLTLSTASTVATADVSVYTLPDGSGQTLNNCRVFNSTVPTDATITVTLLDGTTAPIEAYPGEDLTLASALGGLVLCPGGSGADADTDEFGMADFSGSLAGGGYSGGTAYPTEGCVVEVNGTPLGGTAMAVYFNSADIVTTGISAQTVNLPDVVAFSNVLQVPGGYDYKCDLVWNGAINLADVVRMANAWGNSCQ